MSATVSKYDLFRDADGHIDWRSLKAHEKANGEACYQCGHFILFGHGHRQLCGECRRLAEPEGITHASMIRCPKCGDARPVEDLFEEGEHSVTCYECDHEFIVSTNISFTFTSPARLPQEPSEDQDDE